MCCALSVRYKNGRIQQIEAADSGRLAFDHAESIAYSYAYLMQRAKTGLLELAFDDEACGQARGIC